MSTTYPIVHSGDATLDYVSALVMINNGHPTTANIRTCNVGSVVCDGYPTFILVKCQ